MNFISRKPSHETMMFLESIQMAADFRSQENVIKLS